jgi:hypothetical protein
MTGRAKVQVWENLPAWTSSSERVTGIEPALSAWEADVLPLNYTRERHHCTRFEVSWRSRPRAEQGPAGRGAASLPPRLAAPRRCTMRCPAGALRQGGGQLAG